MNDAQITNMAHRFLSWRLPEHFNPDGGISFKPKGNEGTPHEYSHMPTGTNLFDYAQAEEMVRYMADDNAVAVIAQAFPATDEVTLDDFVLELVGDAMRFAQMWRTEHPTDPENWPMSMPPEEWFEHYLAYLDAE
jgi:hypothetical protein